MKIEISEELKKFLSAHCAYKIKNCLFVQENEKYSNQAKEGAKIAAKRWSELKKALEEGA